MEDDKSMIDLQVEQCLVLGQMADALESEDVGRFVKLRDQFEHLNWRIELKTYDPDKIPERYIWRTRGDNKVSPEHAANDGKIFTRDNPPATGHPGYRPNCRCWAEPIPDEDKPEFAKQTLTSSINDGPKWSDKDLHMHYGFGGGQGLTLPQIGYLGDVIYHYGQTLGIYKRVNQQIIDAVRHATPGSVSYSFRNNYDFYGVSKILGDSVVSGDFTGELKQEILATRQKYITIIGAISYTFSDQYDDPLSFIEALMKIPGISREQANSVIDFLERTIDTVGHSNLAIGIPESILDIVGTPYDITGGWRTKFEAVVKID